MRGAHVNDAGEKKKAKDVKGSGVRGVTFKMKMQIDCAGEGDSVGDAGGGSGERLDDSNNLEEKVLKTERGRCRLYDRETAATLCKLPWATNPKHLRNPETPIPTEPQSTLKSSMW